MLAAGCGTPAALARSWAVVPAGRPTLAKCVSAWNGAVVGDGPTDVRAIAADGRAALMFAGTDHACGLVFPTLVTEAAGGAGVFVAGLGGDYRLGDSPLSGPASTVVDASRILERDATRHTNVRVMLRTGRVLADAGATIPTVPYTILDATTPCSAFAVEPVDDWFGVVRRNVGCVWARTLAWVWAQPNGIPIPPSLRHRLRSILGWRCAGSDRRPLSYGGPVIYTLIACARGGRRVVLRA